jgi:V/A-type H+-transporting ATPase subunit I
VTKPVFLNSPEPMCKVRVITLKDYVEPTVKSLHKTGALHVEEAKELTPVDRVGIENQNKEVNDLLAFVDRVLGYITEKQQVSPKEDAEVVYTRPFREIIREVSSLRTEFAGLQDKIAKIESDVDELGEQKKYLSALGEHRTLRLKDLMFSGDYLFSQVFVLPTETYETIRGQLDEYSFGSTANAVEEETVLYVIGKTENKEILESLVTAAGGRSLPVPVEEMALGEFLKKGEDRLRQLEERSAKLRSELESRVKDNLERIALLRAVLWGERQRLRVLLKASEAKYITLIEGWVPETSTDYVTADLKTSVDYAFIETGEPESMEEPPTKLRNFTALKPFQVVVNLFATPKYREWDPTPIIAYSFATFFGLMLADVVYGIGAILVAKFMIPRFLGSRTDENIKLLQRVIYTCGGVGLVFGLLSGSYLGDVYTFFGFENLGLVATVQRGLQDPLTFVVLALFIGVIHVNIGHTLALIKGVKEKNTGVVINKIGLFLIEFGSLFIFKWMMNIDLHSVLGVIMNLSPFPPAMYTAATYCAIAGLGLIVVGNFKMVGGLAAITWLFDLTGILGDVMSYARIAGVGLATYFLASVFNVLGPIFADFIPGSGTAAAIGSGIVIVIILIIGHMVNLLLGVLTGFIHSLRLCFVEFLFKFYEGGGRGYNPFKLIRRPTLVVGVKS